MMPTQNDGMPIVTMGTLRTTWSTALSRLMAASSARGMVTITVKQRGGHEQQQSGSRALVDERRGRELEEERVRPGRRGARRPMYRPYCVRSGLSRPHSW